MTTKSQKFSISAILMKDSTEKDKEEKKDTGKHDTRSKDTIAMSPSYPVTVQGSTTTPVRSNIKETPRRVKAEGTHKRKRDPIGQILDSLCNQPEKKTASTPSAFSPIVTSSSQLSPLGMLAQVDRRCYQTSPNGTTCTQYNQPSHEAMSQVQVSMEQYQYLQAQRLAHARHMQQQQQQQQLQQQRFAAMNAGNQPLLAQQHNHYQLQMIREHQVKMMSLELANAQYIVKNHPLPPNVHAQNPEAPFWMAWLKSSTDPMTSFPLKESRIPPPPRYQCDSCKKSYSTFGGLSKHKQFHCVSHIKKEFNCKFCDKSYGSLGALKMHIRTHTLPCKCKLCGKAFSRPWLLQGHVRTHTGEKPFKCVHCGRAFADRSNLRAHLQTHSDIKKYGCKNCTKTFSRMSLLLKHEEGSCVGLPR